MYCNLRHHHKNYLLLLLTENHIKRFAVYYLACFLLCYAWFAKNGLLLSKIKPVFFLNKLDVTHNIFMLTNLQHTLLQSNWLCIIFDVLYFTLPILLTISCVKNKRVQPFLAVLTGGFCMLYCSFFSTLSFVSVEVFIAWMIVPLIFYARTATGFYYLLNIVRLLFIIIFVAASLWKVRAGGLFNAEQMSAVLFKQHAAYLASNSNDWYSQFIAFLINHTAISYCLYFLAFIAELSFTAGFFTKKMDKYLIMFFCLFALFDYMLMGINYFTWLPFMGCFWLSKYTMPA